MWQMVAGESMLGGEAALVHFARRWTRSQLDVVPAPETGSFS